MKQAVFVGGLRTPFAIAGKGALKDIRPDDLLSGLVCAHKKRFSHLWQGPVDDMIVGCAYPEGEQGYNIARTVALGSRLDATGVTVNRLCGSSLEAVRIAAAYVRAGQGRFYVVGGVESMSRVQRRGFHFSESEKIKLSAPQTYITMGETAEEVAKRYTRIERKRQEDFAARSHELASKAWSTQVFDEMIDKSFAFQDESIRFPVNREKMASLPPVFHKDGLVTAATSSPMSDGAALGLVMDESYAKEIGVTHAIRIKDAAVAHVPPEIMGMGPVPAIRVLLQRNNLRMSDIVAIEMNEAFAIQALACQQELEIPSDRLNCYGGALAIGHPLGASGLRLLMTLSKVLHEKAKPGAYGIATLCVGGGQGLAMLVESVF